MRCVFSGSLLLFFYAFIFPVKVTRDVVKLIVNTCPNLEVLTIAGIKSITDVIPESLARRCQRLKKANFKNCNLTDDGVCQLAVHCSEIVMLALSGIHDLTDRSIIALAENCPELRELYVSGCDKITKQAVAYLKVYIISTLRITLVHKHTHKLVIG